jgi:hypothetical protein
MEAIGYDGEGMIVIADDEDLEWPKTVLARVQRFAAQQGFYVSRMMPRLHSYHLDDAPNLRSCNLIVASVPGSGQRPQSQAIADPERLRHFYGHSKAPRVRYIRERKRLDYGKAHEDEYQFDIWEQSQ